jgi:hypothetical protein
MSGEVRKSMKKFLVSTFLTLSLAIIGFAQGSVFSDVNSEYIFDLPSATWKKVVKPTATNPNVEYVYGDRLDGHLEIRKLTLGDTELISDLITREQEQKLQFILGYVSGKEENFSGIQKGKVFNYEFTKAGKNMSGRFYYLRIDGSKTVYVLRFTGYRDNLRSIRPEIDAIARSFNLKEKAN